MATRPSVTFAPDLVASAEDALKLGKAYPLGDAPFPGIYRLHTLPRPMARFRGPRIVSLGATLLVALAGTPPWRLTYEIQPLGYAGGDARSPQRPARPPAQRRPA